VNSKLGPVQGIGIFGGTFDPVHFGHLRAAQEAREILALDDFRLMPAGTPPHRSKTMASAEHRLAMLQLAVSNYPGFRIDDREVRRKGNSYMVDTLAQIRAEEGDSVLVLIIGQDAANHLDSWHQWRRIFDLAHIAIMRRPNSSYSWSGELRKQMQKRLAPGPQQLEGQAAGKVIPLEITQLAISSTGIRHQLGSGRSPRFLLPDEVIAYIQKNNLYQDAAGEVV
jgi:nicotinate-nucleotide adenylyltransferase